MVGLSLDIPEAQPDEEDATEKQKGFIHALLQEVGASKFPEESLQNLGKWQASSIIDQLQSFKKQLAGDKPVDTSRITGLNEEEEAPTGNNHIVLALLATSVLIISVFWLFS